MFPEVVNKANNVYNFVVVKVVESLASSFSDYVHLDLFMWVDGGFLSGHLRVIEHTKS